MKQGERIWAPTMKGSIIDKKKGNDEVGVVECFIGPGEKR